MDLDSVIEKITQKKEFSEIPREDIVRVVNLFDGPYYVEEEIVKKSRDLLRRIYSGFGGKKLLVIKNKDADDVLKKHLSTRERFSYYEEVYKRILNGLSKNNSLSIVDLGSGVNGFSYSFFNKLGYKKIKYLGMEAVGQLVDITNKYFQNNKLNARAVHLSLFDIGHVLEEVRNTTEPRIIFMFKVVDALESLERDYTKKLLFKLKNIDSEKIVISFATESWIRRKKFFVQRTWLINFIREHFEFIDDFNIGGERYLVFRKRH